MFECWMMTSRLQCDWQSLHDPLLVSALPRHELLASLVCPLVLVGLPPLYHGLFGAIMPGKKDSVRGDNRDK